MSHALFGPPALGAVFDLTGRPQYVHWHFFQMSVTNLGVIVLMIVVFWLAILLPFPASRRRRSAPADGSDA